MPCLSPVQRCLKANVSQRFVSAHAHARLACGRRQNSARSLCPEPLTAVKIRGKTRWLEFPSLSQRLQAPWRIAPTALAGGSGSEVRNHRCRCHRRHRRSPSGAGRRRGHLPRARCQSAGHHRSRHQADRGRWPRAGRTQRARHQRLRRSRRARRGDPGDEGAPARRGGRRRGPSLRPAHGDRADAERHSLLVLPQARRPVREPLAAQRGPQRPHRPCAAASARDRLCGLPGQRTRRAGRGAPHRGRSVSARRTRRLGQRARASAQ